MRKSDAAHFAFLRTLLCSACLNNVSVEVAHVRYSDFAAGHVNPGMGAKDHSSAVPLCSECHRGPRGQHAGNEQEWWSDRGIDPHLLSNQLRRHTGDAEKCEWIIRRWGFL